MGWSRKDIKREARAALKPDYWHIWFASMLVLVLSYITVVAFMLNSMQELPDTIRNVGAKIEQGDKQQILAVVLVLIMSVFILNAIIQLIISIFLKNPIIVGSDKMFLDIYGDEAYRGKAASILHCFDLGYRNTVWIMLVRSVRVAIYLLMLIIPGIWRYYSYKFLPFVLAEKADTKIEDAFDRSIKLVEGHKWQIFLYDLSFLPWSILGLLSFGIISVFWVHPYKNMADAKLYLKLKELAEENKED